MKRRTLQAVVVVLTIVIATAGQAAADSSGWVRYKTGSGVYIRWTMPLDRCDPPDPDCLDHWSAQRAKAVQRARRAHFVHIIETHRTPYFTRVAIRFVFRDYAGEALSVSHCESRWWPNAVNGQYRGTFQLGEDERRRFGHGPDALTQARAAWDYFIASGRDWSPWGCQP